MQYPIETYEPAGADDASWYLFSTPGGASNPQALLDAHFDALEALAGADDDTVNLITRYITLAPSGVRFVRVETPRAEGGPQSWEEHRSAHKRFVLKAFNEQGAPA